METIIYVYLKRDCVDAGWENSSGVIRYQEDVYYQRQDFDMRDYRLMRVGVSRELWRILQERDAEEEDVAGGERSLKCVETAQTSAGKQKKSLTPWARFGQKRRARMAEELRRQRLLEEAKLRQRFMLELLEDREHSCFVAEEPVSFLEGWTFRGYLEEEWVLHMMGYAKGNHFVILGKGVCLPRLLLQYVHCMKSLRWVISKRQFGDDEEELVEELYEEYGLAVEVQLLEEEREFRKLRHTGKISVTVIDFCEEERVSATDMAKGSIWLDMTASDIKRRRLEERNGEIAYFSLKKEWKQPEKAPNYLDTISKNGYNTEVN